MYNYSKNVYTTDTVKIIIGCSEDPITLHYKGIIHFTSILTRIEERLQHVLIHIVKLQRSIYHHLRNGQSYCGISVVIH
jgi:hypothetical protein